MKITGHKPSNKLPEDGQHILFKIYHNPYLRAGQYYVGFKGDHPRHPFRSLQHDFPTSHIELWAPMPELEEP